MTPRIEQLPAKNFVGKSRIMTFADNQTSQLWSSFMPRRYEILHTVSENLFSLQLYPENFFQPFNPHTSFTKWAAREVDDFARVPEGMVELIIPGGMYAVFQYKGNASGAADFFRQIYTEWLPGSEFVLDNRHHFELLGDRYQQGSPDSEEEVWIPIKPKD